MSRIPAVAPMNTEAKAHDTLAGIGKALGVIPNLYRVTAQSPAALAGINSAAAHGTLSAKLRESIALTVAEVNGCNYCLSVHTLLGKRAGLSEGDLELARDATASDPKAAALLRFAREVVREHGRMSDANLAAVRTTGATDAELLDVITHVVVNIFTNYVNLVAQTDIDFPAVRAAQVAA